MSGENEEMDRLRDEADRERLARRDRDRWLKEIHDAIRQYRRGTRSNWDGSPCGLPAEVVRTLKDLHARAFPDCPRCGGAGWLWRHELDSPGEDYSLGREGVDDTKYTCDRCKGSKVAVNENCGPEGGDS